MVKELSKPRTSGSFMLDYQGFPLIMIFSSSLIGSLSLTKNGYLTHNLLIFLDLQPRHRAHLP